MDLKSAARVPRMVRLVVVTRRAPTWKLRRFGLRPSHGPEYPDRWMVDCQLDRLVAALDEGLLDECIGVGVFTYPPDGISLSEDRLQTQVELIVTLKTLSPEKISRGFDYRWGEVADALA
jgi:hypothetical protein